jgi:hypothetical protein
VPTRASFFPGRGKWLSLLVRQTAMVCFRRESLFFFGVDVPASLDIQAAGALRHSGKSGVGALGDEDPT